MFYDGYMKKDDYIANLPGSLPKSEWGKIEKLFSEEFSDSVLSKPKGQLKNYVYIHKDLGWGLLKTEGKYGLKGTETYTLIKITKGARILGLKMGISTLTALGEVLTGESIEDQARLKGVTSVSFLNDSEKDFFKHLQNFA
tara:strand:+ start:153 stop:575 length:423 start_codon:yes stop_codon:yes gene_type:complete